MNVRRVILAGLVMAAFLTEGFAAPALPDAGEPEADQTRSGQPEESDTSDSAEDSWTGRAIPPEEATFIAINQTAQRALATGRAQDAIRQNRRAALSAWGAGKISGWIGLLSHMPDDGGDGFLSIRVTVAEDITLETRFVIAPDSAIYKATNKLPYGTVVQFSGQLIADSKDTFKETRLTEQGGLEEPSWLFTMTEFKALD